MFSFQIKRKRETGDDETTREKNERKHAHFPVFLFFFSKKKKNSYTYDISSADPADWKITSHHSSGMPEKPAPASA